MTLKKLRQYAQVVEANRALGVPSPQQRAGSDSTSIPTWMRDLPTPPSESEWPPMVGPFGQASRQEPRAQLGPHKCRPISTFQRRRVSRLGPQTSIGVSVLWLTCRPHRRTCVTMPSQGRCRALPGHLRSSSGHQAYLKSWRISDISSARIGSMAHSRCRISCSMYWTIKCRCRVREWLPSRSPSTGTYSITLGPRGRRDAQLIHHAGPSSAPKARVGGSAASASAGDRSGRVLGARDWLGDEHIQGDY